MGEIIIKVPGDVKEIIEVNLPYTEVLKRLGIEKEEKIIKNFFSIKFPDSVNKKTIEETKGDFYEAIFEIND